jgi:two-component system LytT family response regulator
MLKVLIVDDEPLARARLRSLVGEETDMEVAGECGSGAEAVLAIRTNRPDVVLMDVQMSGMDGFGVVEAVGADDMPATVFITAYDEFAIRAFEASAIDYLLKPFDVERFRRAMARVRRLAARHGEPRRKGPSAVPLPSAAADGYSSRFLVKRGNQFVFVMAADVDWVEAARNYAILHVGGARHVLRTTLDELEARLDPRQFMRIRRSTIINLDRVAVIRPWSATEFQVELAGGTVFFSSRGYRHRLRAFMK